MKILLLLLILLSTLKSVLVQESKTRIQIESLLQVKSYFGSQNIYKLKSNSISEFDSLLLGGSLDNFEMILNFESMYIKFE